MGEKTFFMLPLAMSFILFLSHHTSSQPPDIFTDKSALLSLKSHIISDPLDLIITNWTSGSDVCTWNGVGCSTRHKRVVSLDLYNMDLSGTIPPQLGNLSFLLHLGLSRNNFHGQIPGEISRLRRLRSLELALNQLTGTIPSFIGDFPDLETLILGNNSFSGTIPPEIFRNDSKLEIINLSGNQLIGEIPAEIGYLRRLWYVIMGLNQLSGHIPLSIFNISSLEIVNFSKNELSGGLVSNMCSRLPELQFLDLSWNEMSGELTGDGFEGCLKLQTLSLTANKFVGSIPANIGNLTELQSLYLSANNLEGTIPYEFKNLINMQNLSVQLAGLSGVLPHFLFNMSSLRMISLAGNRFHGSLPRDICTHLPKLEFLSINRNNLTGTIPRRIANCTQLKFIELGVNNFTGVIPQEIGNLKSLLRIIMDSNNLEGPIPDSLFNMSTLNTISFVANNLLGSLPQTLGLYLPNLQRLFLGLNNLQGAMPETIVNASSLVLIDVAENQLTGPIPNSFGSLTLLEILNLRGNDLTSSPELSFLTSLANCKHLSFLILDGNKLNSFLPPSIGNLSSNLQMFSSILCGLKGIIPEEIGNLIGLQTLYLQDNVFEGFLPMSMKKLKGIQRLVLSGNYLKGSIPKFLCSMSGLGLLDLSRNQFSESIPACFGSSTSLRNLLLSSNKLDSNIPYQLWELNNLLTLNLSNNSLIGNISQEIGKLHTLTTIDLSMNRLSGEIPTEIVGLQSLISISLASNSLGGSIPESFGLLLDLQSLDLSHNHISGSIPNNLEALSQLNYFNVSFNYLKGQIPTLGPFLNFTSKSYMSNEALCGASRLLVPPCAAKTHRGSKKKRQSILIVSILVPTISILIILLITYCLIKHRKGNQNSNQPEVLPTREHEKISYIDLVRATNGFNESNMIGKGGFGSVYKGELQDGTIIAIKVFNLQVEGGFKSFDTECEILRNVRHRNLTKVITTCSNLDFKALVLEYMPNNNLDTWLYSDNHFSLLQRLDVLIDVATALEYLHYGYSIPVAHCDLKPTNVLLDNNMVAHVCDFGIAKLFHVGESVVQTRTLATFGYMAPEYGLDGLVSVRCDVYSFGILMLETITRRKPTDDMFDGERSLRKWVEESLFYPNRIDRIVDVDLMNSNGDADHLNDTIECLSSIATLALACSAESPDERINMKDALSTLGKIKTLFLKKLSTPRN
ncbi:probable LRR receptor-like serine/threonine-protein kinase At3g47570 [Impatiens glandulifera]|uniref:probable LRR receptor-like serine/threonine-protein kinase At3g47570 n=1 Tax=Impatiens glandulifera TaxID=253017 RepID=UPI001FB19446|nr:probable LRR receptor-like serine/threonine-protein kinase At3g47570 [Impatiens glandulifera]